MGIFSSVAAQRTRATPDCILSAAAFLDIRPKAIIAAVIGCVGAGLFLLRRPLVRIFTHDPDVIELATDAMWLLVASYIVGCLGLCATNILEACTVRTGRVGAGLVALG